jgi:hypothetical protein
MKRERIIYVLLLVIVIVAIIQVRRDKSDMTDFDKKKYWIVKTHSSSTKPIVFGGDSRIYRGISPAEFKLVLPQMDGINLGYSSNGFHPEYMDFVESRLNKNAASPVIVLGISPHNFSKRESRSEHFRHERDDRKKEEIIQYMYFYNLSRTMAPLGILKTIRGKAQEQDVPNYQQIYHFDGWMESYFLEADTMKLVPVFSITSPNTVYSEDAAGIFFRQVEKWTREGIRVVSFRTPAASVIRDLEDSLSGFDELSFKEQFTDVGGEWIEFDSRRYQTYDGSHMDHGSALLFSRDLAEGIREILKSGNSS